MAYTLYGIANCDIVRSARNWLKNNEIDYTFYDFRANPLSKEKVEAWIEQLGFEVIFNKASNTYKELSEDEKAVLENEERTVQLMIEKPTLMKRPVFERDGEVLMVGFKAKSYADVL